MSPSLHDQGASQNNEDLRSSRPSHRSVAGMAHSADATQRLRNEESWVEISSQPSSSSLSSIGEEIVTTGLRVQHDSTTRRRRRIHGGVPSRIGTLPLHTSTSTSSQEEYDESESEEDHAMSSSNENINSFARVPPIAQDHHNTGSESDDDDENATALGRVTDEPAFTPQPNAFSHPPSSYNSQRQSVPGSYFPRSSLPSSQQRPSSYPSRSNTRSQSHDHYSPISPAYQADNDAALRASLTTLLSCAAAARGLPKRNQSNFNGGSMSTQPQFTGLRLVPESELLGPSPLTSHPQSPRTRAHSSPSISSQDAAAAIDKGKRKATQAQTPSKPSNASRATKKKRVGAAVEEAMVSPTLLTWVVSAGVVVLVSVVGFGAGYAIGREVGRQETLASLSDSATCGKEAIKGVAGVGQIRRFGWDNASRAIVA